MSFQTRRIALEAALGYQANRNAVGRGGGINDPDDLVRAAEKFEAFLIKDGDPYRETFWVITVGPVEDQSTGLPALHPLERKNGVTALKDTQQVPVTIATDDAKGFATVDNVTASSADTSVATVTQEDDGSFLVVAGNPGSTVVTFTDGTISGTLAVDVTTGDTASIVVTAGTVEDQPAAAAPAPTDGGTPAPDPTDGTAPTS